MRIRLASSRSVGLITGLLLLMAAMGFAQRRGGFGGFGGLRFEGHDEAPRPDFPSTGEFHFIRLQFSDQSGFRRGFGFASRNGQASGWWSIDWPDAEDHFSLGVQRLTRIAVGEPRNLPILDDHLFDYPWIYATNIGMWSLSADDVSRLREYLLRGGFLVVDDFWESDQWEVFREGMNRILPNQAVTDIAEWRAMYDGRNHMIVAANYNTDVGDAWEYADSPQYPEHMTELAYHYGINYLVYALSH